MVTLRPAQAEDADAVLRFWATSAEDAHRTADSAEAIAALIARDPDALILAFDEATLVGTVIAGWDGWRAHIYRLAVAPSHRRQGIGQSLIEAAERRSTELGATRMDAMVLDENELGIGAWRRAGYRRQAEWARWVKTL